MLKIIHRVNTIKQLKNLPTHFGVEIDIRSNMSNLYLHHDPFAEGVLFDDWLNFFHHSFIILNVKEDGLENLIIKKLKEKSICNYFFLDQTFPTINKLLNSDFTDLAIRLSEFETIVNALILDKKPQWVWIDHFNKFPFKSKEVELLKKNGYKICIVSPELQGKENSKIKELKNILYKKSITFDAVCTKYPELW